ncbi:putative disease resistance RPP13-like protein 1 [Carya illinoinensis]|uniref:putative disease resistance RPP13-like protein 1 n=1 Tax=Carya illinoinensis TaxID=32201 RepID=UPI001C718F44|nr:putative disease resistance RPP13-like protein 1 [Carya illinoinensis]
MFGARNPSIGSSYLGQLLNYGTRGSMILVTTRNDSVALAMHAIATHHLDLLPENDCWSLFEKHAFRRGSSNANPKIKEIGTQIVEKCKGIPLAIKAIGDLLGSKSDHAERYWTTILKSNLWDVPMEKTNIIPALWLPDSICMLCNLQTLKLSECTMLGKWPRDMWKLINLRHLEFEKTQGLEEMPIQIGRLKCLQTLTKFVVNKHDSGSSIEELGKLINLRGKLLIQELQNVRTAKDASLKTKGYLEKLVLEWNRPKEVLGISESQRDVLEDLQPHENLKCLTLKCYGGNGFPNWIGQGLPSLSELELIDYCSALPPLGQLHFLNKLYIDGLDEVVTVGPEFYENSSNSSMKPFGSLKVMRLENLSNWENWLHSSGENEVETFSQLEELYIKNYPKLRAKLPVHPSSLAKLHIIDCKLELPIMRRQYSSLEALHLTNCYDSLTSISLHLFPNLKSIQIEKRNNLKSLEQHGGDLVISQLGIHKCPKFVSFPEGGLRAPNLANFIVNDCKSLRSMPNKMHIFLPSLCYLELRSCPEVESFPEGGLPSNLKQIVIVRCKKLIANWKGWDLQILPSLEWLTITSDKLEDHVESFIGGLLLPTTLTNLLICSFGNLKSLDKEGFQHLTSLVELVIIDCPKLRYLLEKGFAISLHLLWMLFICPVLNKELERKKGEEWLNDSRS